MWEVLRSRCLRVPQLRSLAALPKSFGTIARLGEITAFRWSAPMSVAGFPATSGSYVVACGRAASTYRMELLSGSRVLLCD